MSDMQAKPLNWKPDPEAGYTVERRPDGGLNVTINRVTHLTLDHWREFALDHLLNSDRLTRNLYDLRQVKDLSEEVIQYALEVTNDPSVRNLRVAVVVSSENVREAVQKVASLTVPGGVELAIFEDLETAEAWLNRPLTLLV